MKNKSVLSVACFMVIGILSISLSACSDEGSYTCSDPIESYSVFGEDGMELHCGIWAEYEVVSGKCLHACQKGRFSLTLAPFDTGNGNHYTY